jgi:hypothetical protein
MGGSIGEQFKSEGYDPDNPTKDAIDRVKKKFKGTRNAVKLCSLSDDYGSGITKKYRTLKLQGFKFSLNEVKDLQARLNKVFEGKKAYGRKLEAEWIRNNGFILDGLGFPLAVAEEKKKDLCNRTTQRTGHMILMIQIAEVYKRLVKEGIWFEWLIYDYHDEFDLIVNIEDVEKVCKIVAEVTEWINKDLLKALVVLKSEPQIANSMAEIKVENYKDEDQEIADLIEELNNDTGH